jgi:branched-chain amino acid transport system substrate-binding protein
VPLRLLALLAAAALALSGCLGDDDEPTEDRAIRGHVLTLYSSLPVHGPSAGVAQAVAAGQRQALADARDRAGRYRVRLVDLPASKRGEGNWDPGQVSENASRAAKDPRAIAYLGELGLGASAISVPVTNDAGLLQVSPGDGLSSLTERTPGRPAGPERYYPSGRRNLVRLVPDDAAMAQKMVDRLVALGVDRPALVVGTGVYARELASELAARARDAGIEPVEAKDVRDDPETVRDVPREVAELEPDAVILALSRDAGTARLLSGLERRLPQARLLMGSGVLVGEPLVGADLGAAIPLEAVAPRPPRDPAARRLLHRIARDQDLPAPRPEALWGYESVRLVLAAVRRAQRGGRRATRANVLRAAMVTPIPLPPLALYRLDGYRFELVRTLP